MSRWSPSINGYRVIYFLRAPVDIVSVSPWDAALSLRGAKMCFCNDSLLWVGAAQWVATGNYPSILRLLLEPFFCFLWKVAMDHTLNWWASTDHEPVKCRYRAKMLFQGLQKVDLCRKTKETKWSWNRQGKFDIHTKLASMAVPCWR